MMEYNWPGNIRELENLVKRYTIVGNEPQIIRELSTHKPIITSTGSANSPIWGLKQTEAVAAAAAPSSASTIAPSENGNGHHANEMEMPSLLEIGRRAAMQAEREAIERVLAQTRWNRRQAAKILKISYKALLNKLKAMEEQNQIQSKQRSA
jgi:DNA-binding NtrC family response regulator